MGFSRLWNYRLDWDRSFAKGECVGLVGRLEELGAKGNEQWVLQKSGQQAEASGSFLEEDARLCVGSLLRVLP